MTSDEEVLGKLEACILNHCPRILAKIGNGSTGKTGHLLLIAQNSELAARSSSDVARLAKIEKNLRDALAALEKLSGATIRELNYSLPEVALEAYKGPTYAGMGAPSRTRDNAAFSHRLEALTSLLEGTHELRQKPAFQMQSSSRRNYRATAVAAGCLKVWREEISPEEPPKTLNADRENHLSRFMREVFEILAIGTTPTSAHNSLKALVNKHSSCQ